MRVHHLNCGSMPVPTAPLVCHVLLVEAADGLVLVDSGYGLLDCAEPARRLGPFRHASRPVLDPAETAARQVEALGYARGDVRHIVLTHFDFDHIGGLADFPGAQVHVTSSEAAAAVHSPSAQERMRYRSIQWAHGPKLVEHDADGEPWRGFGAAKQVLDGIALIPLPGHTRGHACVAVDAGHRWVLHCGDAFYHRGKLDGQPIPKILSMEMVLAFDRKQVRDNHARLAELAARNEPDLLIVNAHDPVLLEQARASA
ncbi:MBL fold metallo-hydrolase [Mycolicibacterium bacteremicum]|uniref:MBL fold metallo-hydrolase n=1 Tax=Mycolicibacterium bacteremicum TaxID=564198 RepID=A0A1W9YWN8_MYCBA|nr:MBL fold metallo-hydrolase [Mycolicibacterium bacteremicum]MCV7430537.1 MBL fold metallo-hydrolase [Mycolicibacterium bacteremicum]ORA04170.1 MBL fold metallo-hydrolase [Mycolicibacterium bacteremicum]